ncbi:DUF6221 family protein [Aquipuribacter hungaricus]|uniref:DUF6221 family protein n=2 Tax=Aquipuribacter hungaricus TaxID=545624 RepID=A0ABV7WKC7_9MICO
MVPLDRFVAARLDEDPVTSARERAEAEVKRHLLAAHARTRPFTVHRAGYEFALRVVAGIWADHPDYDPTWRP